MLNEYKCKEGYKFVWSESLGGVVFEWVVKERFFRRDGI